MDTVFAVLGMIGEVFRTVGDVTSGIMDVLRGFGAYIFLAGFFGILFAFLWFIFRYIDKKKLTMPAVMFALFFALLLSGNLLMLSNEAKSVESELQTIRSGTTEQAEETPDSEDIHV